VVPLNHKDIIVLIWHVEAGMMSLPQKTSLGDWLPGTALTKEKLVLCPKTLLTKYKVNYSGFVC
jgi:hypothetical protein